MRAIFILLIFTVVSLFGQTVKVRYLIGNVEVKNSAAEKVWFPLTLNAQLQKGEVIRTGKESQCELLFPDGSVSKIMANSMLEIQSIPTPEKQDGEIFTYLGRFFFQITKKLTGKLKVGTPVSVAAIRGTEFALLNTDQGSSLWVKDGVVEFGNPAMSKTVQVSAWQKSAITLGKPADLKAILNVISDKAAWQKLTSTMGVAPSAPQPLNSEEIQKLNAMSQLHVLHKEEKQPEKSPKPEIKQKVETHLEQPLPESKKPKPAQKNKEETPREAPKPKIKQNEKPRLQKPIPESPKSKPTPKKEEKPGSKPTSRSGIGFHSGLALGAVTIDNQIYNQIGLRPEFSIGKLGVSLDLSLYIDQEGNIRKENWDSFKDIIEKIYYIRWAHKGDPFYFRIGAIDNYRLGFGILMNHYANTVEYPSVIRTGLEIGFNSSKYSFDGMVNNFSEVLDGGGVFAGRFAYRPLGKLEIGLSTVFDANQYKALKDRDGDGVPDLLDDFPDNKNEAIDSDGDGIPDSQDFDRDGDGFTDNRELLIKTFGNDSLYNQQDSVRLKPTPFNINKAKDKTQLALALDASYPILNYKYLQLISYAQYAKYPFNGAWGITAPGFWAKFAFIHAFAEYRIFGKGFLPEYFNTTYELERATYRETGDSVKTLQPYTKRQYLTDHQKDNMKGFVVGADFNLFDFMIFGAEYQNMSKNAAHFRTFRANLDLNTRFIPKIKRAGAYYYQDNAIHLFRKSEGTILGYRIEYEISPSAALLLDFRQTYRDLNGDGKISGSNETVKTTNIQTVIRF